MMYLSAGLVSLVAVGYFVYQVQLLRVLPSY